MPKRSLKDSYCPICLRVFGVLIPEHGARFYTITPFGRLVLRGLRKQVAA